jgi:hypothetical protein
MMVMVQEFRSSRSSGVQEFRSSGVQEFRSSGVLRGADQRLAIRKHLTRENIASVLR